MGILAVPGIDDKFFNLTLFLQNLTNALANGAVYALMALTVVMIYKTTGHLNFAQGEMAMFSTFVVYVLVIEQGFNIWLAIVAVVIGSMGVGAAFERALIQPLESRRVLAPVILTLGLFFILNGGAATIWGTQPKSPIPAPFPGHLDDKVDVITNRVPHFFVTYKAIGVWITLVVLVVLLNLLLKRTKLGLAYRAVAANAESSLIVGIPVKRMLMLGWALAAGIGAIAGAIIAQYRNVLDFNFMAAVLLFGFAAACVGGFDSILGAVVARLRRVVRLVPRVGGGRPAGGHGRDVRAGLVHVRRQ